MIKKILIGAILLVIGIVGGNYAIDLYQNRPSTERVDPITYFDEFNDYGLNMVYEDTRVDYHVPIIEKDDKLYMEAHLAEELVSDKLFYDEQEKLFTVTNTQEVIRVNVETGETTVNNQPSDRVLDIIFENQKLYLSETLLEEDYGFSLEKGADGRLMVASNLKVEKPVIEVVRRKTQLRTLPSHKAIIIDDVLKGEQLTVYGEEDNGYLRVRSDDGIIGFIAVKDIKEAGVTEVKEDKIYDAKPLQNPLNDQVKLVWDQMTVRTTGNWTSNKYTKIKGANVISPTWFEFADSDGNLMDRGHSDYVKSAHQRGLQVWALMSHNFSEGSLTREILTSTAKRQHVINQLVQYVEQYNLDGINIDIENIQVDFSREWVQFMRELYPQMQAIGATVSVDIYMPSAWSGHYERAKISEVVDYFMVMAYDQHWSGSETIGPTSGLVWVEEGLILNLEEVPKEKLVLGIPFFTRIWEVTPEGHTSKAYGMAEAESIARGWGEPFIYDEAHKLQYAERVRNDTSYHVWLEDETSIRARMDLIEKYDLAGYAAWKIGLEGNKVWDELGTMGE